MEMDIDLSKLGQHYWDKNPRMNTPAPSSLGNAINRVYSLHL